MCYTLGRQPQGRNIICAQQDLQYAHFSFTCMLKTGSTNSLTMMQQSTSLPDDDDEPPWYVKQNIN
jgi:hypothetical protein